MDKVSTIFIGSGEFSIELLKVLLGLEFISLDAVITQPDKPVGRKQEVTSTPVKKFLLENKVETKILQPDKISTEYKKILEEYKPELIIVAAYGQIIPEEMLEYPKYKSLNLHGSLLPLLRGAVPIPMSILLGFKETGVTMQRMVYEMDKGPVISTRKLQLDSEITTEELVHKLSLLASEILKEDLIKWIRGEIKEVNQEDALATYCYKEDISKEKAEIKYDTDVHLAERMIRAFYSWPIAWVKLRDGKIFKIFKRGEVIEEIDAEKMNSNPEVKEENIRLIKRDKKLYLKLNNGLIELLEVQLEGKKRDKAINYIYLTR